MTNGLHQYSVRYQVLRSVFPQTKTMVFCALDLPRAMLQFWAWWDRRYPAGAGQQPSCGLVEVVDYTEAGCELDLED